LLRNLAGAFGNLRRSQGIFRKKLSLLESREHSREPLEHSVAAALAVQTAKCVPTRRGAFLSSGGVCDCSKMRMGLHQK
jgi:hypothetical protein